MPDQPYTDDDLRAEAARQHHTSVEDPDFMGTGEQMQDQEITVGGGVAWDDFRDETFEAAQRSIHDLITGAADVSAWAVNLGADGLESSTEHAITVQRGGRPIARIHFAFEPGMDTDLRDALVEGIGEAIADAV